MNHVSVDVLNKTYGLVKVNQFIFPGGWHLTGWEAPYTEILLSMFDNYLHRVQGTQRYQINLILLGDVSLVKQSHKHFSNM